MYIFNPNLLKGTARFLACPKLRFLVTASQGSDRSLLCIFICRISLMLIRPCYAKITGRLLPLEKCAKINYFLELCDRAACFLVSVMVFVRAIIAFMAMPNPLICCLVVFLLGILALFFLGLGLFFHELDDISSPSNDLPPRPPPGGFAEIRPPEELPTEIDAVPNRAFLAQRHSERLNRASQRPRRPAAPETPQVAHRRPRRTGAWRRPVPIETPDPLAHPITTPGPLGPPTESQETIPPLPVPSAPSRSFLPSVNWAAPFNFLQGWSLPSMSFWESWQLEEQLAQFRTRTQTRDPQGAFGDFYIEHVEGGRQTVERPSSLQSIMHRLCLWIPSSAVSVTSCSTEEINESQEENIVPIPQPEHTSLIQTMVAKVLDREELADSLEALDLSRRFRGLPLVMHMPNTGFSNADLSYLIIEPSQVETEHIHSLHEAFYSSESAFLEDIVTEATLVLPGSTARQQQTEQSVDPTNAVNPPTTTTATIHPVAADLVELPDLADPPDQSPLEDT